MTAVVDKIGTTHQLETKFTTPQDDAVQVKNNALSGWLDKWKKERKRKEGRRPQ
jgi:hypothetical protein